MKNPIASNAVSPAIFITTAMNLLCNVRWLNEVPLMKTRQAPFVRLMP
jgi:hypothetical protein